MSMSAFDLEERLILFAVQIIKVVESLPATLAGRHIAKQLVRSGTSPAPNYAEAQSAESRKDFVHKLKISLKELRETLVWLKMARLQGIGRKESLIEAMQECHELISIFVCSIKTAERRKKTEPQSADC